MTGREASAGAGSWRNWAGNQRTDPARTVAARDTGDVVDAVKAAARDGLRVKAIGSRALVHRDRRARRRGAARAVATRRLAAGRPATGLATVPAGMTLRALNPLLWAHGWALPNLGDIDAQTVAGAIATGTHGTGARHRGLADAGARAWSSCSPTARVLHLLAERERRGLRGRPGRARRARRARQRDAAGRARVPAARASRPRVPLRRCSSSCDELARRRPRRVLLVPAHRHRRHQAQQPHRRRRARARPGRRVGGRRAARQRRVRPGLPARRRGARAWCRGSTG